MMHSILVVLLAAVGLASPSLPRLNLANSRIESLHNVNATTNQTDSIDLSGNRIVELPQDAAIFNVSGVRLLDLSHNLIHTIVASPFRTLRTLRLLNLSANAIDTIGSDAFHGITFLQSLDLSRNNLSVLPDYVFKSLGNLQHLNLSGNRLQTLTNDCFGSLLKLQQLDLSSNQLSYVAPSTLQALASLSRLILADNIELGSNVLVGTGRRLQTVDASRTGLKHVPATLTHSVRTLRLAGNTITAIQCGDLDSYPLLQLLDVTANVLYEIEEDALGRLEMLTVLYLTNNKLRAIPRSLPDHLQILHLEFNSIEQIVAGDLLSLPNLEVLLLNDNVIKVVQEGAFNQMTSLVTLDLSRNPISILPAATFFGPTRLQMLRLSELTVVNPLTEDMAFPVPAPEHLVRLDLSGSPGLAQQLLADTAALIAFRELQELNLANTGLTNIRSDILHYLPQMHDFHLTGNSLNCSGLLWLALWMRRQDQPEYRKVVCAQPPELYGTLVVDLQDTDIQEIFTTVSSTIRTTAVTPIIISSTERSARVQNVDKMMNGELATVKSARRRSDEEERREKSTTTTSVLTTEAGHRSNPSPSSSESDQLHLFPIALPLGRATKMGSESGGSTSEPFTDKATAAMTNGHIDQINPSITEPSNYNPTGDAAVASSKNKNNFAGNKSRDNVTAMELLDNVFMEEQRQDIEGMKAGTSLVSSRTGTLFAVLAAVLGIVGVICSLMLHFRRRRRNGSRTIEFNGYNYDRHQDIEVNSLASMHELW